MKNIIFKFRIELLDLQTGATSTLHPEEEYKNIFELWDEMLLCLFHPSEGNYHYYSHDWCVKILIWRTGGRAIVLAKDLDLGIYFDSEELMRDVTQHLGFGRYTTQKLITLKEKYIYTYNAHMYYIYIYCTRCWTTTTDNYISTRIYYTLK